MHRRMAFMRNRVELDLKQLLSEIPTKREYCDREYVGSQMGNQFAFIELKLRPKWGFSSGRIVQVSIKITLEYPYQPPIIYNHDPTFCHPNKDPVDSRFMFSFVDKMYWKPVFELSQVICGLEMVLITPDLAYTNLRTMSQFTPEIVSRVQKMSAVRPPQNEVTVLQPGMIIEENAPKPKSPENQGPQITLRTPEKELESHAKLLKVQGMDIEYDDLTPKPEFCPLATHTYPKPDSGVTSRNRDFHDEIHLKVCLLGEQQCRQTERSREVIEWGQGSGFLFATSGNGPEQGADTHSHRVLRRILPAQKTN